MPNHCRDNNSENFRDKFYDCLSDDDMTSCTSMCNVHQRSANISPNLCDLIEFYKQLQNFADLTHEIFRLCSDNRHSNSSSSFNISQKRSNKCCCYHHNCQHNTKCARDRRQSPQTCYEQEDSCSSDTEQIPSSELFNNRTASNCVCNTTLLAKEIDRSSHNIETIENCEEVCTAMKAQQDEGSQYLEFEIPDQDIETCTCKYCHYLSDECKQNDVFVDFSTDDECYGNDYMDYTYEDIRVEPVQIFLPANLQTKNDCSTTCKNIQTFKQGTRINLENNCMVNKEVQTLTEDIDLSTEPICMTNKDFQSESFNEDDYNKRFVDGMETFYVTLHGQRPLLEAEAPRTSAGYSSKLPYSLNKLEQDYKPSEQDGSKPNIYVLSKTNRKQVYKIRRISKTKRNEKEFLNIKQTQAENNNETKCDQSSAQESKLKMQDYESHNSRKSIERMEQKATEKQNMPAKKVESKKIRRIENSIDKTENIGSSINKIKQHGMIDDSSQPEPSERSKNDLTKFGQNRFRNRVPPPKYEKRNTRTFVEKSISKLFEEISANKFSNTENHKVINNTQSYYRISENTQNSIRSIQQTDVDKQYIEPKRANKRRTIQFTNVDSSQTRKMDKSDYKLDKKKQYDIDEDRFKSKPSEVVQSTNDFHELPKYETKYTRNSLAKIISQRTLKRSANELSDAENHRIINSTTSHPNTENTRNCIRSREQTDINKHYIKPEKSESRSTKEFTNVKSNQLRKHDTSDYKIENIHSSTDEKQHEIIENGSKSKPSDRITKDIRYQESLEYKTKYSPSFVEKSKSNLFGGSANVFSDVEKHRIIYSRPSQSNTENTIRSRKQTDVDKQYKELKTANREIFNIRSDQSRMIENSDNKIENMHCISNKIKQHETVENKPKSKPSERSIKVLLNFEQNDIRYVEPPEYKRKYTQSFVKKSLSNLLGSSANECSNAENHRITNSTNTENIRNFILSKEQTDIAKHYIEPKKSERRSTKKFSSVKSNQARKYEISDYQTENIHVSTDKIKQYEIVGDSSRSEPLGRSTKELPNFEQNHIKYQEPPKCETKYTRSFVEDTVAKFVKEKGTTDTENHRIMKRTPSYRNTENTLNSIRSREQTDIDKHCTQAENPEKRSTKVSSNIESNQTSKMEKSDNEVEIILSCVDKPERKEIVDDNVKPKSCEKITKDSPHSEQDQNTIQKPPKYETKYTRSFVEKRISELFEGRRAKESSDIEINYIINKSSLHQNTENTDNSVQISKKTEIDKEILVAKTPSKSAAKEFTNIENDQTSSMEKSDNESEIIPSFVNKAEQNKIVEDRVKPKECERITKDLQNSEQNQSTILKPPEYESKYTRSLVQKRISKLLDRKTAEDSSDVSSE